MSLEITPIKTKKDKIVQPPYAEANIIPRINSCCLFIGASGCGKTTTLANLLQKPQFLYKCFHRIILVSPTARSDDIQKSLDLDDEDIIDDLKGAPMYLQEIMNEQRDDIEEFGADKAPKMCVIFDDAVADKELLNSDVFVKCFIACRHYNFTTFICSQSYKAVPKKCRLQAKNIIYFAGANSENETIMEDRCPPFMSKKKGLELVEFATRDRFSFLHIVMAEPFQTRYRKNFGEIIHIPNHE
jgi:predicted ATPase